MIAKAIAFARRIWSAAPLATTVLAAALAASLFFAVQAAVFWHDRPPRAEREQPIAAWMTPRYVARSWGVPREVVLDAVALEGPLPGGPISLAQIAEARGVAVEEIIAELETAIAAHQAQGGDQ